MNLINKIGQRKFTIYTVLCAILIALGIYFIKFQKFGLMSNSIAIIIGIFLFSFSNIILSFIAHKSRDYRLNAVNISLLIMIVNSIIFSLSLINNTVFTNILFLLCIIEVLFSFVFLIFAIKHENKKKKMKEKQTKLRKRL